MDDLFNLMKTMSENINSNYKEQQIDSNIKYNQMNDKFDELKNEIQEMNKHVESINETVRTSLNKLEQSVEKLGDHVLSITNINNDEIMKSN